MSSKLAVGSSAKITGALPMKARQDVHALLFAQAQGAGGLPLFPGQAHAAKGCGPCGEALGPGGECEVLMSSSSCSKKRRAEA